MFPGQNEEEYIETCIGFHFISMIVFLLFISILLLIVIILDITWFSSNSTLNGLTLVLININAFCIFLHLFVIRLLNQYLHFIIVTNSRVIEIYYTTIFHRERKMIDIAKIQDMKMLQKGILARILNYGRMTLHNASGETIFIFDFIPNIMKKFNIVNHIYQKNTKKDNPPVNT